MDKHFLVKINSTNPTEIEKNNILSILESVWGTSQFLNFEVKDVVEEDIHNKDNGTVELGRRRINLRKSTNALQVSSVCKVKNISGPDMMVEYIRSEKAGEEMIEIAQCIWFVQGIMHRAAIQTSQLEVKEEEKVLSIMETMIKRNPSILLNIINDKKILAIKTVRDISGLGLKEAKDLVESVTQIDIEKWRKYESVSN